MLHLGVYLQLCVHCLGKQQAYNQQNLQTAGMCQIIEISM